MPRKDIQHITLKPEVKAVKKAPNSFLTAEGITVKSVYNKADLNDVNHLGFAAGIAPNLRGASSTMYVEKPWIISQCPNFSTIKENNAFYKHCVKTGHKSISIAIKNTQKEGITINTVEDMIAVLDQIPLDKTSVAIAPNEALLPIMAFYIVAAETQGVNAESLCGTIQNNTTTLSSRITSDVIKYISKNMPKYNGINLSSQAIKDAGASCEKELAYTLASGLKHLHIGINEGLDIDTIAQQLSFSWSTGMNHFMEIAKLRAARLLWAKIVKQFNPKKQESLTLRSHSKTSALNFLSEAPLDNIARTTIEATAAIFGGTQSLQTNASKDTSTRIAKNTQLFLQEETNVTKTVDPWGGSYYIEKLTHEITQKTWGLIEDIDASNQTISTEEVTLNKQSRIDTKQDIIIGLNQYVIENKTSQTNTEHKKANALPVEKTIKAKRNNQKLNEALNKLKEASPSCNQNLLELAIIAARERATLEEINTATQTFFNKI